MAENFLSNLFSKASEGITRTLRDKDVNEWLDQIADADKREKNYRKEAQLCVDIYEAGKGRQNEEVAYNILYANTMTLSPALYNSTPRPVVRPRFKGKATPLAIASARVLQNVLEYVAKNDQPEYTTYDDLMKSALIEALVPGRGLTRFKYDAQIEELPQAEPGAQPLKNLVYENVCGEEVPWDRIRLGYAKSWVKVPWIAFEHFFTREECVKNFGKAGNSIQLTAVPKDDGDKENKLPADAEGAKFAHVWEIWDKATKEVLFVSDGAKSVIKRVPDPLKLEGFYPLPKPMQLFDKISSMVPKPIFMLYEEQARELNSVTIRIGKLTRALKIRGYYDGTLQDMAKLMESEDNTLIPAMNTAAMQQGMTLDKAIWLMPIEKIITVLQQLYLNRMQCKQTIYEITGIADIMRGSTQASETLGAQEIKQSWGTLRLKRMQKEVARYACDSLRMQAEIVGNHFNVQTLQQMTGLPYPTQAEKMQVQMQAQQMQMQPGPDGQPAQLPPEMQEVLDSPTWEEILQVLRNDVLRNFLVTIETNSTIDAEATEDRENVTEFMNAMGQLLSGLVPLIEKGMMPFGMAKQFMLAVTQKFRFGAEVEEYIKGMAEPPPPKDPVQAKAEADMARDEKKFQLDVAKEEKKAQIEEQKAQNELQLEQARMTIEGEKLELERQKLGLEKEFMLAEHQVKMEQLQMQLVMKTTAPAKDPNKQKGAANAAV